MENWNPSSKVRFAPLVLYSVFSITPVALHLPNTGVFKSMWGVFGIAASVLFMQGAYIWSKKRESPFAYLLYAIPGSLYYGSTSLLLILGVIDFRLFATIGAVFVPSTILPMIVYYYIIDTSNPEEQAD